MGQTPLKLPNRQVQVGYCIWPLTNRVNPSMHKLMPQFGDQSASQLCQWSATMDFLAFIVCAPFSGKPFFAFKSPMATVLNSLNLEQPLAGQTIPLWRWCHLLHATPEVHNQTHHLIVTQVSFNKERSAWPDFQHESITLEVHAHPNQPQPPLAPVTLQVSRTVLSALCYGR